MGTGDSGLRGEGEGYDGWRGREVVEEERDWVGERVVIWIGNSGLRVRTGEGKDGRGRARRIGEEKRNWFLSLLSLFSLLSSTVKDGIVAVNSISHPVAEISRNPRIGRRYR